MGRHGRARREASGTERLRHRRVPTRTLGDKVIAARPRDGGAVVMEATAVVVWNEMDRWTTEAEIDERLASEFPDIADEERIAARTDILRLLGDEDLVERS